MCLHATRLLTMFKQVIGKENWSALRVVVYPKTMSRHCFEMADFQLKLIYTVEGLVHKVMKSGE